MIDSLLPGISAASGLEVRHPVQYALQSRADAQAFIRAQLDEEMSPAELAGMERAYKRLGLLPDSIGLRDLMLELLTEQVVGYYDPHTDRLYVVEGAPAGSAGPVVAHELVHALQDQRTNLDSLVAGERGNDRQMAAQAAAEGQAMLVMLALQAAEMTGQAMDPGSLPDLGPMLRPALETENSQFPVFQRSPALIKETLIFPYIGGASFVQALYRAGVGGGVPVPFGALLPQSTEQVLDPEGAFLGERDTPTEIELNDPAEGWEVAYANTLGQLETTILLRERAGEEAVAAADGWDGDRFVLLNGPGEVESLVWYSVWDGQAEADRFARALRGAAKDATAGPLWRVERLDLDGRPVVRLVVAPSTEAADAAVEAAPPVRSLMEVPER